MHYPGIIMAALLLGFGLWLTLRPQSAADLTVTWYRSFGMDVQKVKGPGATHATAYRIVGVLTLVVALYFLFKFTGFWGW